MTDCGPLVQVPPIFSAISVNGRRMYEAARAGEDIRRDPRNVHVLEFRVWQDLNGGNPCPQNFNYFIRCGKGTYVRSLVHDLVRTSPPAHCGMFHQYTVLSGNLRRIATVGGTNK